MTLKKIAMGSMIIVTSVIITALILNTLVSETDVPLEEKHLVKNTVRLFSEIYLDPSADKHWMLVRNNYNVTAYDVTVISYESKIVWNEDLNDYERIRTPKHFLVAEELAPSQSIELWFSDYGIIFGYHDPTAEGYIWVEAY